MFATLISHEMLNESAFHWHKLYFMVKFKESMVNWEYAYRHFPKKLNIMEKFIYFHNSIQDVKCSLIIDPGPTF